MISSEIQEKCRKSSKYVPNLEPPLNKALRYYFILMLPPFTRKISNPRKLAVDTKLDIGLNWRGSY